MSTSVRPPPAPMPVFEPSTDFPTLEDEIVCPRRWALVSIVAISALVAGLVAGFAVGRSTAPASVPAPCVEALQAAEAAFTAATAQLGTIEAGALTMMEEMTEAESVVQDARLGQAEIQRLRSTFTAAAVACRSS